MYILKSNTEVSLVSLLITGESADNENSEESNFECATAEPMMHEVCRIFCPMTVTCQTGFAAC